SEAEWDLLRSVVARSERPLSFVQIHDSLRASRNTAGIERTNEELRSLIKQAINTGVLERLGKGSRVMYRIAQPIDPDQVELISEAAEPVITAPSVDATPDVVVDPDQVEMITSTTAPVDTPVVADAATAETASDATPKKSTRRRSTRAKADKPAETPAPIADEPVAEVAPAAEAAPKKPTRRRSTKAKAEAVAEAEPAAETAPKKSTRRRRTKAADEESEA
ncbi:MAG TPA: hypothetical protein PKA05_19185, partial [Roseiflexaceae bacterium]|nr:hypothetical protein [Roseiflexaceae bacterium]